MVEFALTDEQIALRDLARDFVEREVKPVALELDARPDPADCYSWDLVEKLSAVGLRTVFLDKAYGGVGADAPTLCILTEELAVGDLGVSVIMAQTWKIGKTIEQASTPEQLQRFLPTLRDDPRGTLAIGITEPDMGSDYIIPYPDPKAGPRTTAVRDGDHWVLNGMKHFISNGNRAALYLIFARTDLQKPMTEGMTAFLVPRDTPGFTTGTVHNKMGERLANNAELIFQNCRIPDANRFGAVNGAFEILARFFPASNAYAAASVLGVGRAAYEKALEFAKQRVQGGRPIIEHQAIRMLLTETKMRLDSTRDYIWHAAWASEHREHFDATWAAMPKVLAAETAVRATQVAIQIHGGYGVVRELGLEKLYRDAAVFFESDGTQQALTLKAANAIHPLPNPAGYPLT